MSNELRTYKEIEDELITYIHMIQWIDEYYFVCKYMNNPKSKEEKFIVEHNSFLSISYYSFWFILVVEICKLVQKSQNQKYNFHKFLNKLICNRNQLKYKQDIDNSVLQKFQDELANAPYAGIINRLSIIRDEYYAHTDRNRSLKLEEIPTYDEINLILTLLKKIIDYLSFCIFYQSPKFLEHDRTRIHEVLIKWVKLEEDYIIHNLKNK